MKPGPSNVWRVVLAVAVAGFLYLGLRPSVVAPPAGYDDEVAHALVNFALGMMVYKAFTPGRAFLLGLVGLAIWGGVAEFAQTWAPTRAPAWPDFYANLVGVFAAGVVGSLIALRGRKTR